MTVTALSLVHNKLKIWEDEHFWDPLKNWNDLVKVLRVELEWSGSPKIHYILAEFQLSLTKLHLDTHSYNQFNVTN